MDNQKVAQILQDWKDGKLTRANAKALLIAAGCSEELAERFLNMPTEG